MLEDLEETRYPFDNMAQFLAGGYWSQIEAIHLLLGWLFIVGLAIFVLRKRGFPASFRLALLYFALAIFTNPAYDLAGLKVNEVFGLLAILAALMTRRTHVPAISSASIVVLGLLAAFIVSVLHNLLIAIAYPILNPDAVTLATRAAVNFKVLVLALNLLVIGHTLRDGKGFDLMIRLLVVAGTFGLCMYVVQAALLFTGTLPYGTFLDAGYIGVPAFGSVSVERGHFGKFMAPLFPFFLYGLIAYRWRAGFGLYVLIACLNPSASSMAFFIASTVVAAWLFRSRLASGRALAGATVVLVLVGGLAASFSEVLGAVGDKIYQIAIQGDESTGGGRSIATFVEYISTFPLGIGYGGSTLRTAPGLAEINAAHFAFVTQYSLLALPLLAGFFYLVRRTLTAGSRYEESLLLRRAMNVGVLVSLIIFAADILWFVPTIWLSYEVVWACAKARRVPRLSNASGVGAKFGASSLSSSSARALRVA